MVHGIDDGRLNSFRECANAAGDRRAHLALGLGVDRKKNGGIYQVGFEFFTSRAHAKNHDDRLNTAAAQLIDAAFNYSFLTEGKQRFEGAHALGTPRSEDYGRNRIGLWS